MKQLNLFSKTDIPADNSSEKSPRPSNTSTSSVVNAFDSVVEVTCPESNRRTKPEGLDKRRTGHWTVFIDGASRNNPGPAGAGIYIIKDGEAVLERGYYLGKKTNNQAEYLAAICGLYHIKEALQSGQTVRLVSDSELVVKQLSGQYKVRHPELKPLHVLAQAMARECNAHIQHVLRTENVEADRMANQGINNKTAVPEAIVSFLQNHGISI